LRTNSDQAESPKSFLLFHFHLSKQILQSGIDASAREAEILRLIAAGMRNQEIADHLFISLHTVKRHIANALRQAGRHSPHGSCCAGERIEAGVK
jgi:DNA-binding NarL/FixJ family response regulator